MAKYGYINVFWVFMEKIVVLTKKFYAWPSVDNCCIRLLFLLLSLFIKFQVGAMF